MELTTQELVLLRKALKLCIKYNKLNLKISECANLENKDLSELLYKIELALSY